MAANIPLGAVPRGAVPRGAEPRPLIREES